MSGAIHTFPAGTAITLQALIDLHKNALLTPTIGLRKRLTRAGQKRTLIRGRGIEFDATREYQAGDDIRHMAWRVTARSLKPHIKVYREEKERPVWLALDLSPSLYFGTRCQFKSVKSILQAALTGWHAIQHRERVGAVLNCATPSLLFAPKASETHFLSILNAFATASAERAHFTQASYLDALLNTLQQQVRAGSLVHLYSDFLALDTNTEQSLIALASRAQINLNLIYDPFEAQPPPPHAYMLTNGTEKLLFNMRDAKNRSDYQQLFATKIARLTQLSRTHHFNLTLYGTDNTEEVIA